MKYVKNNRENPNTNKYAKPLNIIKNLFLFLGFFTFFTYNCYLTVINIIAIIISTNKTFFYRGKVKHELRVQIHELRIQIHELRVQIRELRVQYNNAINLDNVTEIKCNIFGWVWL